MCVCVCMTAVKLIIIMSNCRYCAGISETAWRFVWECIQCRSSFFTWNWKTWALSSAELVHACHHTWHCQRSLSSKFHYSFMQWIIECTQTNKQTDAVCIVSFGISSSNTWSNGCRSRHTLRHHWWWACSTGTFTHSFRDGDILIIALISFRF